MQNTESVTDKELFLQDFNAEDDSYTMTMDEVEQTLLYHSVGNGNVPHTPESTMMTLAGILQKEYAMRRIFSKDVANAHRLGNMHIHNADMPTRLYCGGHSPSYVAKYGLSLPNLSSAAKPAKYADVFLEQLIKFAASMQGHFSGAVGFDAVNMFVAPYLVGLSDEKVKQCAQILVYEFAQQAVARGGQVIFSDLNLYWGIPKHYQNVEAIGPGGVSMGVPYKEFDYESKRFMRALMQVYEEGDGAGRPFFFPKADCHITADTVDDEEYMNMLGRVASKMGSPYFVFDRGNDPSISQCCFDENTQVDVEINGSKQICAFKDIKETDDIRVRHGNVYKKAKLVVTSRGKKKMIKIRTERGDELIATQDHLFLTTFGDIRADDLSITDTLIYQNHNDGNIADVVEVSGLELLNDYDKDTVYCFEMENEDEPYFTMPSGWIVHNCRLKLKLSKEDVAELDTPWTSRFTALQNVTMNLPAFAQLADGNETGFYENLYETMMLAKDAHRQKLDFIDRVVSLGPEGPLNLLLMEHDGTPYFRYDKTKFLIGMVGLNEAVQLVCGQQLHESNEAIKVGMKMIAQMNANCKEISNELGMTTILEQTPAESTAYRFARLDVKRFGEPISKVVKGSVSAPYYTNSTYLDVGANVDPIERVKKEGKFHPLIDAGAISHVWLGNHTPSAESVAQFVRKTFYNTQNSQITFSPEFTACNACQRTGRGAATTCGYCGSENVDVISRVTGYMSKVSSWNPGKRQEFLDRKRVSI